MKLCPVSKTCRAVKIILFSNIYGKEFQVWGVSSSGERIPIGSALWVYEKGYLVSIPIRPSLDQTSVKSMYIWTYVPVSRFEYIEYEPPPNRKLIFNDYLEDKYDRPR